MNSFRGFSLFELLITLAIIAIVVCFAIPDLSGALQSNAGEIEVNNLARSMHYARSAAISSGRMVTVCRSINGDTCGGEWQQGILVFTDTNADHVFNAEDQTLRYIQTIDPVGTLSMSSFPNRQYLQFNPMGSTNQQSGNFTWCPPGNDIELARQLIFTHTGRTRFAQDGDGDGVREGANGNALNCD